MISTTNRTHASILNVKTHPYEIFEFLKKKYVPTTKDRYAALTRRIRQLERADINKSNQGIFWWLDQWLDVDQKLENSNSILDRDYLRTQFVQANARLSQTVESMLTRDAQKSEEEVPFSEMIAVAQRYYQNNRPRVNQGNSFASLQGKRQPKGTIPVCICDKTRLFPDCPYLIPKSDRKIGEKILKSAINLTI